MRLNAQRLSMDQATVDNVLDQLTNIPELNAYADERAKALLGLSDDDIPANLDEDLQKRYWDAYALFSKELILIVISQL